MIPTAACCCPTPLLKWLASYADMAAYLHNTIPRDAKVLIVGCGNSSLSADMYDDGYRQGTTLGLLEHHES